MCINATTLAKDLIEQLVPTDNAIMIRARADTIISFIWIGLQGLDREAVIKEVKRALLQLKVPVIGLVSIIDISVIRPLEGVLNN